MQKKIIALAVAGLMSGAAFAQSNVTISGLARMSVEQYKLSNVGALASSAENRVSDQSSMLVFSGKEDLGGGMYAGFRIDTRYAPDLGGMGATGNTNVHLGGSWGQIAMGRQDLHYGTAIESYKAYTLQNILSNGLFSQVNGAVIANATRTPNVVMYDSPNMSGFSARLAVSSNWAGNEGTGLRAAAAADPGNGKAVNIALNYANGPIKAGYSYWSAKAEGGKVAAAAAGAATVAVPGVVPAVVAVTPGAAAVAATFDQRGDTLQFGYSFPMGLNVGVAWNKSKTTGVAGEASRTAWLLPVAYTMGNNQFAFTYAKAGNTSGVADSGATAYTLAYSYSMSKRTNVGLAYSKLDNKSAGSYDLFAVPGANGATLTPAGADVSQMSFNMNHAF